MNVNDDAEKLLAENADYEPQGQGKICLLSRHQTYILSMGLGILFLLQLLTLGISVQNLTKSERAGDYKLWRDCGKNASEARERGCVFDIMMTGWVMEDCYNKALSEEYLLEGQFQFFYDEEGEHEIPLEVLRLGEHTHMYTNDLHHRAHCVYVWKLQALALESQAQGKVKLIDSESYTYDHTLHCARILVNSIPSPPYSMNYGEVDFLSCGPYLS